MAGDDIRRIELSEDELKRAVRAGLDTRAIADEQITRYARPEEREEVGRRIDPSTAHVFFVYAQTMDPYGDDPDLPEEMQQVGREYFAVDPNEGVAVALYDLPEGTRDALADKRRRTIAVRSPDQEQTTSGSSGAPRPELRSSTPSG